MTTLTPMDPRRQAAIRAMLVAEAAGAPPVTRPRRTRLQLASAAAVTAAAATVVAAVLVAADPAAAPSYATWTAVPVTARGSATAAELRTWASACTELTGAGIAIAGVGARKDDAARRTPLVDRRGDYLYCLDVSAGSGTAADPFIALSGLTGGDLHQAWTHTRQAPVRPPAPGDVLVLGGDDRRSELDQPGVDTLRAYQIFGLAGPGVTGVDVVLGNGLRITATVRDGLWGAWWPAERGEPTDSRLDVHTSGGTRTVRTDTIRLR